MPKMRKFFGWEYFGPLRWVHDGSTHPKSYLASKEMWRWQKPKSCFANVIPGTFGLRIMAHRHFDGKHRRD